MQRKYACCVICVFLSQALFTTQIILAQNLILNGSMTSGEGADIVAPSWSKYSTSGIDANTPDINDSAGALNSTTGYYWTGGTPTASPDGGTWQNVFGTENFTQTVTGLVPGSVYYFKYYYASQGITTGPPSPDYITPFPPSVTISGATGYVNPPAGKLFEWNIYSGLLTATASSLTIVASQGNHNGYIALDGFYLGPPPTNVLIVLEPLPDTICNSGNASFKVLTQNAATYQWQVNTSSGWSNIHDNVQYKGALTNTLNISNVTTSMNKYQYRCYVTSNCCNDTSSSAFLYVLSSITPSVNINVNSDNLCNRDTGIFKADVSSNGLLPHYQWMKNLINVGADTDFYSDNNLQNGDIIKCVLNTDYVCATTHSAISNSITVNVNECTKGVYIPSAFTPNADGKNDYFKPIIYGHIKEYLFTIYNRWGQIIFNTNNAVSGWDGNINGLQETQGVYVWISADINWREKNQKLKQEL